MLAFSVSLYGIVAQWQLPIPIQIGKIGGMNRKINIIWSWFFVVILLESFLVTYSKLNNKFGKILFQWAFITVSNWVNGIIQTKNNMNIDDSINTRSHHYTQCGCASEKKYTIINSMKRRDVHNKVPSIQSTGK